MRLSPEILLTLNILLKEIEAFPEPEQSNVRAEVAAMLVRRTAVSSTPYPGG